MHENLLVSKSIIPVIPMHRVNEFLICHQEFRYNHLVHVTERLIENYYSKNGLKEIKFLTDLHAILTKRDHFQVTFKHNAFHVNGAYTRPEAYSLES